MSAKPQATLGSPKEQFLLRQLLREKGFTVNSEVQTAIFYVDGVARIDVPDAFWMPEDEMREMYLELKRRVQAQAS